MSVQNPTIPTATQAKGIDSVILDLQTHLDFDLDWLTNGMGRAYRLSKVRTNQSIVFLPEVYLGTDKFTYFAATPDNDKKGQSIFIVGNEGYPNQQLGFYGLLEYDVSIIFSVNLKLIDATLLETEYFDEHQIEDVRESLIRNLLGKDYKVEVNEVVRQFEDVYSEFDVTQDRGIAHAPMSHFRFNCTVTLREDCAGVSLNRCGAILQNLSEDDKNNCILPTYDFSSVAVQDATTAQQQTDIIDWICVAPAVTQYTMSFDAINESINAYNKAAYSAFDWNVPFSFSVWVKFTDTTSTQAILAKRTGGFIGFLFLLIGGNITVTMRDTGSTGIVKATNSTTLVNNTWYQLGFSYDGSTNASGLNISVDGVDAPTTSTSDTLGGSFLNSSELSFGQSLSALYLGGKLGYIRAWNIELSAADKLADYNSGVMNDTSTQAANLVMGWKSGTSALFGTVNWLFGDLADETESPASIGMDYTNRTTDLPA